MSYVTELPAKGYANVYKKVYKDILGNSRTEYYFGEVREKKEDLPQYYEYDCVAHKHIGIAKINITMEE